MAILNKNRLVLSVVSKTGKENATAKQGPLQSLNIDIDAIGMPGIGADGIRDYGSDYSIKIEQEENSTADMLDSMRRRYYIGYK